MIESNAYKFCVIPDAETLLKHFALREMVQLRDSRNGQICIDCRITAVKEDGGIFRVSAVPWSSPLNGGTSWVIDRYEFEVGTCEQVRLIKIVSCLVTEAVEVYRLQERCGLI